MAIDFFDSCIRSLIRTSLMGKYKIFPKRRLYIDARAYLQCVRIIVRIVEKVWKGCNEADMRRRNEVWPILYQRLNGPELNERNHCWKFWEDCTALPCGFISFALKTIHAKLEVKWCSTSIFIHLQRLFIASTFVRLKNKTCERQRIRSEMEREVKNKLPQWCSSQNTFQ